MPRSKKITPRKIQNFLLTLASGTDLKTALRRHHYTFGRALQILRGSRARKILNAIRALAAIQQSLILRCFTPFALNALTRHLDVSASPDHQIKGALSLLKLTPPRRSSSKPKTSKALPLLHIPDQDIIDLTAGISKRRSAQRKKLLES